MRRIMIALVGIEEQFDQAAVVERLHHPDIRLRRPLHHLFVADEALTRDIAANQSVVDRRRREVASFHRQVKTGGKEGIDEPCGVSYREPTVTRSGHARGN